VIFLIGIGITLTFGQPVAWMPLPTGIELVGLIILTFLYTFFFGAGTNEEPGWRGFALPKLQLKYSPLVASLILGLIWGLWHAPIYIPQYDSVFRFILFLLNTIKIAIVLTWFYNRTGGSVLSTALLHTIGNLTFEFIPTTFASEIIQLVIMILLIFIDRMWKKN
jgi:membrane protease YdiL (CAAX protease family)